jgi:HlyD family secretion protein
LNAQKKRKQLMKFQKFRPACLMILLPVMIWSIGCQDKLPPGFAGSGTLEATEVTVSALTTGTILKLTKEEGDSTTNQELLAEIDVERLTLQRAQLAAGLKEIEAGRIVADAEISKAIDNLDNLALQYKRIKELNSQGTVARQQYDDVATRLSVGKSQLTAAKAQQPLLDAKKGQIEASLKVLDRQIADGTVLSPLDGVVVEKYVEPGEVAVQGGALYKIADLANFWIKIYLAETDMGRVPIGQKVEVRVDAYPEPLMGIVTWTSPEAEFTPKNVQTRQARAELVYAVKVTIVGSPRELKIGMPAEVYFPE